MPCNCDCPTCHDSGEVERLHGDHLRVYPCEDCHLGKQLSDKIEDERAAYQESKALEEAWGLW